MLSIEIGLTLMGRRGSTTEGEATVEAQTAEFGSLTLAGADAYQITDSNGDPVTGVTDDGTGTATGYTLTSGGLLTPTTNGAFTGQDAATIDITCDQGSATITLSVVAGYGARTAAEIQAAMTAAVAADDTAAVTIYCRGGTTDVDGVTFSCAMSSTNVTGMETRGATRAHTWNGGYIRLAPHADAVPVLDGAWQLGADSTLEISSGVWLRCVSTVETIFLEPENDRPPLGFTAGTTTEFTLDVIGFKMNQLAVGKSLMINATTGDFAPHDGVALEILSKDDGAGTVVLDLDSTGYTTLGDATIEGYKQNTTGKPTQIKPLTNSCLVLNGVEVDNTGLGAGYYPDFLRPTAAACIYIYQSKIRGTHNTFATLGWVRKFVCVDTHIPDFNADLFAFRTNRVNLDQLPFMANWAVSGVDLTGGTVTVTTSTNHGLVDGDSIVFSGVGGTTELNDGAPNGDANASGFNAWFARVTSATTFVVQEIVYTGGVTRTNTIADVDGSAFTAFTSGGTVYLYESAAHLEGNTASHASDENLNAYHTDGIQGSSSLNMHNWRLRADDNLLPIAARYGIATQSILLNGGATDPTFCSGIVRGHFSTHSAPNAMFLNKARADRGDSVNHSFFCRMHPTDTDGTGNYGSQTDDTISVTKNLGPGTTGFTQAGAGTFSPADNVEVSCNPADPVSLSDVVQGTVMLDDEGFEYLPLIENLGVLTWAEAKALILAQIAPKTAYAGLYGPTADPDGPLYIDNRPDAFASGDWTATAADGGIVVAILSLPAATGTITDIQYRVDGGAWVSTGGTGGFTISSLTNGVEYDIEIAAEDEYGIGDASDVKARTPEAAATSLYNFDANDPGANKNFRVTTDSDPAPWDINVSSTGVARAAWTVPGLTIGQQYTFTIDGPDPAAGAYEMRSANNTGLSGDITSGSWSGGTWTVTFTPLATTYYIGFYGDAVPAGTYSITNGVLVEF